MEVWRRVKGHEGYEISDKGRVRKSECFTRHQLQDGSWWDLHVSEYIIPQQRDPKGQSFVLMGNKKVFVAELKAEAFGGLDL